MPRQNRRRADTPLARPASSAGARTEDWRGEEFAVRPVTGQATVKSYRCPGCDQLIGIGVAHLVTWPAHDSAAEDRRHWHRPCWDARGRRAPGVQRSRSAPRY